MRKYKSQAECWVDSIIGKPRYDFEEMFRDFEDPWNCSGSVKSFTNHLFLETLFYFDNSYKNMIESINS